MFEDVYKMKVLIVIHAFFILKHHQIQKAVSVVML